MTTRKLATLLAGGAALVALALMAAVFATVLVRIAINADGATGDYIAFYSAGWLVRGSDAASLYDAATLDRVQHLLYPGTFDDPFGYTLPVAAAWAFAPLSMLPFTASYFVWLGLNALLLAALLYVIDRQILRDVPGGLRALFLGAAAIAMPTVATLVFGQVDLIVLAGLLGGYLALRGGRPGLAGLALCIVLLKPQLLVGVGLLLVAQREWRAIGTLTAVGLPLMVIPSLLTSPETLLGYIQMLTSYSGGEDGLSVNADVMANWRGFMTSLTNSGDPLFWAPGLAVIVVAALAIAWPRWRDTMGIARFDRAYSLAVVLPLLVSPHLHTQSLVLLALPAALALRARLIEDASAERQQATVTWIMASFAALFFLPFFAIQGLSLTFFFIAAAFGAIAFRWPAIEGAALARDDMAAPLAAKAA